MGKAEYKVAGGKLIRTTVTVENGIIRDIKLTGDFFMHPEDFIEELEETLRGAPFNEKVIVEHIKTLASKRGVVLIGVSPEDFAKCIMMAGERNE
ncbi:MAG: lipoate protein ligase C-terminal domain-containing protein [Candidatus Bathyarchaeia archaeon]